MNGQKEPLLAIRNLHTRFHIFEGVVNAVDGVDLEVFRGETVGLVGESGCGKSVTALSILQLLRCPPAEIQGRILFEGKNLLDLDREGIRKIRGNSISMVFQEPMTSLNPVLTKPGPDHRRTDIRGGETSSGDASRGSVAMG